MRVKKLALHHAPTAEQSARSHDLLLVGAQAGRMTATVDALLAVARAETDPEDGRVDLVSIGPRLRGGQN
jgi:hypothetical protein